MVVIEHDKNKTDNNVSSNNN